MTRETRRAMAVSMSSLMCKDHEKWIAAHDRTLRYQPTTDLKAQSFTDEEFVEWYRQHVEWTERWLKGAKGILRQMQREEVLDK